MTRQTNPTLPAVSVADAPPEATQSPFQQTKTNEFIPPPRFIVEDHPEAYNNRYEIESESENENEDEENQTYTTYPAGVSDRAAAKKLREPLVLLLKNMLDQCNPHVKAFRSARDRFDVEGSTESSRQRYLWLNQKKLRSSSYAAIQKAATRAGAKMTEQGSQIFIPATFTGGKRYMKQHYYDAMALCKYHGFPDIFITFTCNPKWPEVTRYLKKYNLTTEDRPEILCRVFKMKLDNLIGELTKNNGSLFGPVAAVMYTIEFQKRGMPHAHILVFMEKGSKFPTADDIDKIISAEIPDKTVDSDLTSIDANGFPAYMRRIDGRFIEKNGIRLDNGFVVPYNRDLMLRYRAHMNVEWCVQTRAVKYLFKYIHKGPDYASAAMDKEDEDGVIDEIKTYYDCKIYYCMRVVVADSCFSYTFSYYFCRETWLSSSGSGTGTREWVPRKRGFAIGRIAHIHPSGDELYFLRVLLNWVRGPTSYEDIRTVDGVLYPTYEDACYALGLMDDDKKFIEAIKDASDCSSATYARKLFARMLVSKSLSQPHVVWEATWEYLTDDILYKKRRETGRPDMNLTIEQIKNIALTEIENHLLSNGRSLKK
ncbi:uncharacterized protein LOC125575320 [Brassica napus]|uniref:uncharacterized protein LOC125575320 n=1 Tax=Brassica napus TaxID=3708 RepID=UPI002079A944|nr:uncharacterized protein LOC125575320 [Brassica napus]